MNALGIAFLRLVVQVTLAIVPAAALHLLASRRGPVSGAWVAAASLVMIFAITILGCFAPPRGETATKDRVAQIPSNSTETSLSAAPRATGSSQTRGWTLDQARSLWRQVGLRLPSASSPSARWAGIAAALALAGTTIGLVRLLAGLWAVRECRRRGKLIDDFEVLRLTVVIKSAMGCNRGVELREMVELDSPATAGWLRPVVLLPADWRSWSQGDLHAVLAHELAHIKRSDYGVGLVARTVLAIHFYHPLVRWLTARLLTQQELAADAVGAHFAGGREAYLAVLSRMALRQDRRISWWPARAFSPAKGTLIRRIRMLKVHGDVADRGWRMPARVLAVAFLSSLALGVWMLPRPLRGDDRDNAPHVANDVPVFDLSYIPDDAMGVFAIHPAAIFRRQGMGQYAAQLNALKAIKGLDQALHIPLSKTPLTIEQIEQMTVGVYFGRRTDKDGPYKDRGTLMAHGLMVRTIEPFDWSGQVRSLWPNATEVRQGSKSYLKVHCPWLGKEPCFFVVDSRTVFGDEESVIRKLVRRTTETRPEFARGTDWKKVEHDLVAVILDNHNGRILEATKRADELDEDDLIPTELMSSSNRWVFGLADSDDFLFRAVATCHDSASAQTIASLIANMCHGALKDIQMPHKDAIPDHLRMQELTAQLLNGLRVEAVEKEVRVGPSSGVKLSELLPLIAKEGL